MTNIPSVIATYTVCKFIEEVTHPDFSQNLKETFDSFSADCGFLGGDVQLFKRMATRELNACRLMEDGMGAGVVSGTPANNTSGIAGFKPEEIGVPVEAQQRHTARNSIFRRKKPNRYYMDQDKF